MIKTERLVIRRFTPSDAETICAMRSDGEVMRFIGKTHSEKADSERWMALISEPLDSEGLGYRAVEERSSGAAIGWCGLWRLVETGEVEVGYAIAKEKWGKGFATEAARAVVSRAFAELGLDKVVAVAYPENDASINVMKKLGMSFVRSGTFYGKELVQYSVTAPQWRELNDEHD